jgi:hypothetical protein
VPGRRLPARQVADPRLRHPWLRPRPSRPGSGDLTGSVRGSGKELATSETEFPGAGQAIMRSGYVRSRTGPEQRLSPNRHRSDLARATGCGRTSECSVCRFR